LLPIDRFWQLLELVNRIAHVGAVSTLVETTNRYRIYFGVYVRNVSHFTPSNEIPSC